MKIRNGFVSNSSSSSFVILGVKTNEECDDMTTSSGKRISSLYVEGDKFDYIQGYVIADGDGYDFTQTEVSNISELIKEVATTLNVPETEVKLISGVRPC